MCIYCALIKLTPSFAAFFPLPVFQKLSVLPCATILHRKHRFQHCSPITLFPFPYPLYPKTVSQLQSWFICMYAFLFKNNSFIGFIMTFHTCIQSSLTMLTSHITVSPVPPAGSFLFPHNTLSTFMSFKTWILYMREIMRSLSV
jgi:hypothetical protein